MANGEDTFTELALLPSGQVANNDEIPVWDVSAAQAKKATRADVVGATLTGGGMINTNGKVLNMPADGTTALLEAANAFTQLQVVPRIRSVSLGSILDDGVASFTPFGSNGIIVLVANNLATCCGVIMYRCGGGSQCALLASSAGTLLATVVDQTLTGTTGVDGKVTVSANGGDGKIYVENRRGASTTSYTILELG